MLRLNDIKLPLDHSDEDLAASIAEKLELDITELVDIRVFKRSYDARKKSDIQLIYQVDVVLDPALERALLARQSPGEFFRPSPDTSYHFVARASADFPRHPQQRPLVIGFGPCGILAALLVPALARGKDAAKRTASGDLIQAARFPVSKRGFAALIKNFSDRTAGSRLDELVQVDTPGAQFRGNQAADGRFSRATVSG